MNAKQAEIVDDLLRSGWRLYKQFPRWNVYVRRDPEHYHYFLNPASLKYITVFKNGRTAEGHYAP